MAVSAAFTAVLLEYSFAMDVSLGSTESWSMVHAALYVRSLAASISVAVWASLALICWNRIIGCPFDFRCLACLRAISNDPCAVPTA